MRDILRNLIAVVCGETVKEDRIWFCCAHECRINRVSLELLDAFSFLPRRP